MEDNTHDNDEDIFYALPDDEDTPSREQQRPPTRNPLLLLLKLVCTPIEGWKELKSSRCTSQRFAWGCFYPLTFIAALSDYAALFYNPDANLPYIVTESVIIFMCLLLANFCTLVVSDIIFPSRVKKQVASHFGKNFIMAMLSILALTITAWNLLPPLTPILSFIPIYIIYLIARGVKFLRVPTELTMRITVVMGILIIGLPFLFNTLFTRLIPQ